MNTQNLIILCCSSCLLAACAPPWPAPEEEQDEPFELAIEPNSAPTLAARVLRLSLRPDAAEQLPTAADVMLMQGKLGQTSLSQLAEKTPSASLQARLVAARSWRHNDRLTLAPRQILEPSAWYTLVVADPLWSFELQVSSRDPLPLLELLWPPLGQGVGQAFGVWCAARPLTAFQPTEVMLEPAQQSALIVAGVGSSGASHCVRLVPSADIELVVEHSVPPVLSDSGGTPIARLDPAPLSAVPGPAEPSALACQQDEMPFGPGCVTVADDRMWLRSLDARLWSIVGAQLDLVLPAQPGQTLLIQPLPPASEVSFELASMGMDGSLSEQSVTVHTTAPMSHLVISEVLANPIGPEPQQEWVEIFNDGSMAASLDQYHIQDIGGDSWLTGGTLPPGGYALLVNESFDDTADYDPLPASGTLIVRLPSLGKNGLNNQGEPLKLLDANDFVVSRFPASPKPQPGQSVARIDVQAPSDDAAAFAIVTPTPGAPNAGPPEP